MHLNRRYNIPRYKTHHDEFCIVYELSAQTNNYHISNLFNDFLCLTANVAAKIATTFEEATTTTIIILIIAIIIQLVPT